jgi:murein DD-endopeptidase MepM/ murein hydrolase activator NlpD
LHQDSEYLQIKELYENKMAQSFGMKTGHRFTREFSDLMKQSFNLAAQFASFDRQLKLMDKMAQTLEVDIHKLDEHLLNRASFLRSTPTILPTRGWITSFYGRRVSPYSGQMKMHEGIDIGAKIGTPVQAPADGVVIFTGRKPGFGILVQIDHGYGIETIFAHASSANVQKGQLVKRGDLIAHVGNTGMSTGPHLHYEIRVNGTPVDPLYYILN